MGTLGNQPSWPPYDNIKDCSQGFCSLYCPQWCYIIFPPPPPYYPEDDDSGTSFSPLVIAIIGILASAFLLVSYYTVISKYCRNVSSSQRNGENDPSDEHNENQNPSNDETWQVSRAGLDETLIKSIAVCKYKRGDGLVEGTDCSVCLSEFEEDESLRLLPKCSHAFHLSCIDTWLKSHSNCPLCRANVVPTSPLTIQIASPLQPSPSSSQAENNIVPAVEDSERRNEDSANEQNDVVPQDGAVPKTSDVLGGLEGRDIVVEIREDGSQHVRRSVSMDATCHVRNSVADILCTSEDETWCIDMDDEQHHLEVESSSKHGSTKCNNRSRMLHCVGSPVPMKRSFSSGRFTFTRQGRGKNVLLPM